MLPANLQLAGRVFAVNGEIRVADLFYDAQAPAAPVRETYLKR
jgi:hypothetical protein